MKKSIFAILGVIVFLGICGVGLYYFENYDEVCYTKVDNEKIKKLSTSSEMKYEYSLVCYKDNGKSKNVKFKTTRELRNDAYLFLELRSVGVHTWKEVQFDELPNDVKKQYE